MKKQALPLIGLQTLALACVLALPIAALAQTAAVTTAAASAPSMRAKAGEIEVRARVVELDKTRRTATLRGPKGNVVTMDVPADVKNFDQVKVGDELVVRYAAAVAVQLEPASKSGIRERVESTTTGAAAAGAMPGAGAVRTVEVIAVIQALDRQAGTATLRGAQRTVTVNVPAGVDTTKLKVGDEVHGVFVEAAVISVERAPAPASKPASK